MSSALIIHGESDVTLTIAQEAHDRKAMALEAGGLIGSVTNQAQSERAAAALKDLSEVVRLIERSRKDAKAPFLDWGRKIDTTASEFIAEVRAEQMRISKEIGDYETEQRVIRERAEAAAREEQARIEREAREAQLEVMRKQAAAEEEAKRLAALAKTEAQKAAVEAMKADAAAKAAEELKVLEERKEQEAEGARAMVPQREQIKGLAVRTEWDFEVTDIWALLRARPDMVNVEPRRADLKALINGGTRSIPGVRVFEKTTVSSRGGSRREVIEA